MSIIVSRTRVVFVRANCPIKRVKLHSEQKEKNKNKKERKKEKEEKKGNKKKSGSFMFQLNRVEIGEESATWRSTSARAKLQRLWYNAMLT